MVGFGGSDTVYLEKATLVFFGEKQAYHYELTIAIMQPPTTSNDTISDLPSVLGRDVLNNWRMLYDFKGKVLDLDVLTADNQMSLEEYLQLHP